MAAQATRTRSWRDLVVAAVAGAAAVALTVVLGAVAWAQLTRSPAPARC